MSSLRTGNAARDVLEALALRCEQEEGSIDLDAAIFLAIGKVAFEKQRTWDAPIPLKQYAEWYARDNWRDQYTRNMAAAVSIVPKDEKGGWFWRAGYGSAYPGWAHLNRYHPDHCDRTDETTAYGKTPELALCAAALRARAALAKGA